MDSVQAGELLKRERARIEHALASIDQGRPQALAEEGEPGELGSESLYQDEFDAGQREELAEQLEALERAEARLAAGTYGLSVESGDPIPDQRLEAQPTAERTLAEQEAHDRG